MDTGASSHLNSSSNNLSTIFNKCLYPSVRVGNGKTIPITNTGHSILPTLHRPLHLHNVLVTPNIILNLIFVRQFTRDNNCTIKFDAFGFSVKDFLTHHILLRCDSAGDLYPVTKPSSLPSALLSISPTMWHQRLGHPGEDVLRSLVSRSFISCNKEKSHRVFHTCQLGKHVKLPFSSSLSIVSHCFEIAHSDIWTYPIYKYNADGSLSRYKDRLVANGSSHQLGIDYDETFSPLDVNNAFLNGDLSETVYMYQPPRFVDYRYPHHVCRLQRSVYGLKQAPRAWFHRFAAYVTRVGFFTSRCDSSLFIYRSGSDTAYLLIYVDDIVLIASSTTLLHHIISSLHSEFDMTDLGALNYFLGISVTRDSTRMFLSHKQYAIELLERAYMLNCNPTLAPSDTKSKLGLEGTLISDHTLYRSLAGGLQYLTFTHPDLPYVMQQICLYMHDPREPHLTALKRILRYIQGTLDFGLQLYASFGSSLIAYSDTNWVGCPATRRSTYGYCVFLGNNLLSWSSKRQHTLSRSSSEAEYRGVVNDVAETTWLRNLLRELHTPLMTSTLVYCDNVSAVYLSANHVQHQRTKHIEIDIHFVRDMVTAGLVRVLHVPSRYQYADIFTKGLLSALFEEFHTSLSVRSPPAQTAGESLAAAANLSTLEEGQQVYGLTVKFDFDSHQFVLTSIMDMYGKYGEINDVLKMLPGPNTRTHVIHGGLVDKGLEYYFLMTTKYGVHVGIEHCVCILDLLGRSGRLTKAEIFIKNMPVTPNDFVWRSLLAACRIHGNSQLGKQALNHLFESNPSDDSAFMLYSNVCATGEWEVVHDLRVEMESSNVKKKPVCSWIKLKRKVSSFALGDKSHPHSDKIYS
ncbi:ribonuclease H-like domain-containing protein [Tanacetum coccineum]